MGIVDLFFSKNILLTFFLVVTKSFARSFATAVPQTVELQPALVKHLKPEVVSAIISKTDQLLIKKLNFVGPAVAVRLNTASKIVLQALTQDNCLKILTEELQDPWVYYWTVVKDNATNPDKWLESLKEVKDLPFVAHNCWIEMMRNGVHPRLPHYHTYFHSLSLTGESHMLHDKIDEFERKNTLFKDKGTDETYNLVLEFYLRKGIYPLAKLASDDIKLNGFVVKSELTAKLEELASKYDENAAMEYYLGNIKEEPACVRIARENSIHMDQQAKDLLEQYYQPAVEKLIVKE